MRLNHAVIAVTALSRRELTKFLQQKGRLFSAFVRPALWLFVFGVGFRGVYGVDAGSGELRWRFQGRLPTSKGVDWAGYQGFHLTPLLHDGRVFAGTRGTYFHVLDANDGTEVWSSKVGSSWIGSPAVILDEAVYYGLSDGFAIMGFRHDRGAQTLFFQTASPVFAQPQPYGEKLIFGTLAGRLFSIDTVTGELQRVEMVTTATPQSLKDVEAPTPPTPEESQAARRSLIDELLDEIPDL